MDAVGIPDHMGTAEKKLRMEEMNFLGTGHFKRKILEAI